MRPATTEAGLSDLQKIIHKNDILRSKCPDILEHRAFKKFSNDIFRNKIQENLYLNPEDIFNDDQIHTK